MGGGGRRWFENKKNRTDNKMGENRIGRREGKRERKKAIRTEGEN